MRRTVLPAAVVCLVVSLLLSLNPPGHAQAPKVATKLLHTIPDVYSFWWSPDSKTLAVVVANLEAKSSSLVLYDAALGKARAEIKDEGVASHTAGVSFTPDGRALVLHTDRVRIYDAADGKLLRQFAEGTEPINYYHKIFVPVSRTSYNSETGRDETTTDLPSDADQLMELPTRYLSGRVVSPDGKSLLVRGDQGKAQVYDLGTGELKFTLEPVADPGPKKSPWGFSALGEFSPDGRLILTTHRNRTPRLWNAATGAVVADLTPQSDIVIGARFSADGKFVATTSFGDGVVRIWEAATGKLRHTIGSDKDRNYFAAWNPANNSFVTKTRKWEVNIWNAETGALVAKLDGKATKEKFDDNLTFVYSPDGKILLTEARNVANFWSVMSIRKKPPLIAHLWDAETGKLITSLRDTKKRGLNTFDGHEYFWSPAGNYLVTAGVSVKVWSRRGELVQDLESNALARARLSPDGKLLAFAGDTFGLGSALVATAKVFVGKLPKWKFPKTYVWQIEEN